MKLNICIALITIFTFTACEKDEVFGNNNLSTNIPKNSIEYYINGEKFDVLHILPNDTIVISFILEANCNKEARLETVSIDVITPAPSYNRILGEALDPFRLKMTYDTTFSRSYSERIDIELIFPDFNINFEDFVEAYSVDLEISAKFGDDSGFIETTNGVDTYGLTALEDEVYFNNGGLNYSFKLYNNYVGKPLDDPKGLGYNLFTQEYTNIVCELDSSCNNFLPLYSTLLSLTYLPEVNQANSLFTPSFGYLKEGAINFAKIEDYYWDRNFFNSGSVIEDLGGIVYDPNVGDVFKLEKRFPTDGTAYLKVSEIFEDKLEGYVAFDVFINNAHLNK